MPNRLTSYIPDAEQWSAAVKVMNAADADGKWKGIFLMADALKQRVTCYHAS